MRILVIDDEKTLNVTAALIMPVPEDVTPAQNKMWHQKHKEFTSHATLAKTVPEGIDLVRYGGPWDILCLDYDMGDHTGGEVSEFLYQNPKLLPEEIYLTSFNPIGKHYMYADLRGFYSGMNWINSVIHLYGKV